MIHQVAWLDLNVCTQQSGSDVCVSDQKTILVVGDSMVPDAVRIIGQSTEGFNFIASTQGACTPTLNLTETESLRKLDNYTECSELNQIRFSEEIYQNLAGVVIITAQYDPTEIEDYLAFLSEIGVRKVLVVGPYVQLNVDMADVLSKDLPLSEDGLTSFIREGLVESDLNYRQIAGKYSMDYLSPVSLMCEQSYGCPLEFGGTPFTSDKTHGTLAFTDSIVAKAQIHVESWISDNE
jgi:hypothetical protein